MTVYRTYLRTRSAGYMQIESGNQRVVEAAVAAPSPASELSGYDKIALSVVRAIHFNTNAVIPLDVANRGNIRDLRDEDVVEVPCVVNANGARPMHVGAVPDRRGASAGAGEGLRAAHRRRRPGAIDGGRPRRAGLQSARAGPRHGRPPRRRAHTPMVTLDRGMGLLQATATNIIGMVGVGPFLTIPFMVTAMGGPHILYAWAFGAVLALCDGLVYAQLGAALPGSGGRISICARPIGRSASAG